MRLLLFIGIVTLHVAVAIPFTSNDEDADPASVGFRIFRNLILNPTTSSLSKFAGNFYQVVANDMENRNRICSPISVSMILSMLASGARGNTKKQLERTLHFSENQYIEENGLKWLNDRFNEYTDVTLRLANKIYLSNDIGEPEAEFTEVLKRTFNSDLEKVDFAQSQISSDIINKWVEDKTNKRIKNIIQPDDLNMETALVLVNAVYFKGEWRTEFDRAETKRRPFWVAGTTEKNINTMYSHDSYHYGELKDVDARYVKLPYKSKGENDEISMFIILPNKKDGLKKLEQNFADITVQRLIDNSQNRTLDIYLPKFKIQTEIDLKESLRQMGLTNMFTSAADFTGIASGLPLRVSKIKQKAFIEIDENGSEAAAVTVPELINKFGSDDGSLFFLVDRPFMGIIATSDKNPVNLFTFSYTGQE